ncbi:hypothetical protein KJ766_03765, partial [Patescibacteria group bacterium]|nr:hypothetical protein [Patescibacteria group bacterium]
MSLDTRKTYSLYDKSDIYFGLEHLPEQFKITWEQTRGIKMPESYSRVNEIVVFGMGGSALGPHVVQSVFWGMLKVPMKIISDYIVPKHVGPNSLVILSSFSGNTEEVLVAAKEAKRVRAKIVVLCTGGALADWAKKENAPAHIFDPGDLAKEPRLGTGFSIAGTMALLERVGLLKVSQAVVKKITMAMGDVIQSCGVNVNSEDNPAKIVAKDLRGRAVLIVASEHLLGNAHIFTNQIN